MHNRFLTVIAVAAALLVLPTAANAVLIWDVTPGDGGAITEGPGTWANGGGNWNTGSGDTNWSNANLDVAQFGNTFATAGFVVDVNGGVTASGLIFKRGYTLQGAVPGPITLQGTAPEIAYPAGAAKKTYANIYSNIDVTDGNEATADDLVIRGAYVNQAPTKDDWTNVGLYGSNTYTGKLDLEDGILVDFHGPSCLSSSSTGTVIHDGCTLRILTGGTYSVGDEEEETVPLELYGYGFATQGGTGSTATSRAALMFDCDQVDWKGDIILMSDASIASATCTTGHIISGDISGDHKLRKTSNQPLILTGTCTYSGGTDVYRNVLQVDGTLGTAASTVTVGTSSYTDATLKGTGSILGNVVVNSVGAIEAGDSVGTLTVNGDVTVNGKFKIEYDSVTDTIDKLIVNGNLDLSGATMSFSDIATPPEALASGAYVFATYTGTLTKPTVDPTGIPAGFIVHWSYNGNSIALIPEPAMLALLAGLALALAGARIRR